MGDWTYLELVFDEIVVDTGKARLFRFNGLEKWIPHSLVLNDDCRDHSISVPDWFIKNEELDHYVVTDIMRNDGESFL